MSRAIHSLLRRRDVINHHLHHRFTSPPTPPHHPFSSKSNLFISQSFSPNPTFTFSRLFHSSDQNRIFSSMIHVSRNYYSSAIRTIPKKGHFYGGYRFFSVKSSGLGVKVNGGFAKKVVFDKPVNAVRSSFSRYSEAIGLQAEAFCKRNYLFLLGAGGVVVCALLWRIMFGIANTFIGFSEGMAKYGFLALSSAIVAFAGLYIRSRFTINPDKVYRMAMTRLNTSAGILEVMGPPLSGTDLRAYVMSGGGLTMKNFKPSIRSKRCFLIFPIRGSERKGLVSVEVKKKKGQVSLK